MRTGDEEPSRLGALHQAWQEALRDPPPGVDADAVLDRVERTYRALAEREST